MTSDVFALGPFNQNFLIVRVIYSVMSTYLPSLLTALPNGPESPSRATVTFLDFGSYLNNLPLVSPLRIKVRLLKKEKEKKWLATLINFKGLFYFSPLSIAHFKPILSGDSILVIFNLNVEQFGHSYPLKIFLRCFCNLAN